MLVVAAIASASALVSAPVGARQLGTLKISEAGLGTLNLPLDKTEDPAAAAALVASIEAGCNFVDTAEAYGFGSSERLTAWAAKQAGVRIGSGDGDLHVATKFAPLPWRPDAASVVDACRASAERLGVEQIPLYQSMRHAPAPSRPPLRPCMPRAAWLSWMVRLSMPLACGSPFPRHHPAVQGIRFREAQGCACLGPHALRWREGARLWHIKGSTFPGGATMDHSDQRQPPPAAAPATTPASTPAAAPVATPATAPVAAPATALVAAPTAIPVAAANERLSCPGVPMRV